MTKKRLREIRDMLDLTRRLGREMAAPGASEEVCMMASQAFAVLAFEAVPELLDEIERLQAGEPTPGAPVYVKVDPRGGTA